jgi:anti-anti-sigma factor
MNIGEEKRGDVKIVNLRGRLDMDSSPTVEKQLMSLLEKGERRLVIDFSNLTYISSLGLRVLVIAAKYMQKNKGELALAALSSHILEIFKIASFTSIFPIYSTCDEAVARLQANANSTNGSPTNFKN